MWLWSVYLAGSCLGLGERFFWSLLLSISWCRMALLGWLTTGLHPPPGTKQVNLGMLFLAVSFFFLISFYLFVYFWLCWAFIAAWAFSLGAESRDCSLCVGSAAVAPELQSACVIISNCFYATQVLRFYVALWTHIIYIGNIANFLIKLVPA